MLSIDGKMGEGGGQVLRSSLALSLLTSTPFRMTEIRAGRSRPGLMRQHLACVNAATEVGASETTGAEIGSTEITFAPKTIKAFDYAFAIGGAGSTTLVFQTVLYPLLFGTNAQSTVKLEGGTHNPMAPPMDFLQLAFLPLLARMGADIEVRFERHGFYPAGGGRWSATIRPAERLAPLRLLERGEIRSKRATALVSQIPGSVAVRELGVLAKRLEWEPAICRPLFVERAQGPGNALMAVVESDGITEVFTAFGDRHVRAETVAENLADEVERYLRAGVPVGEHLADQLLLPLALGSGGAFRMLTPSSHFTTQVSLVQMFLGVRVEVEREAEDVVRVTVPAAAWRGERSA